MNDKGKKSAASTSAPSATAPAPAKPNKKEMRKRLADLKRQAAALEKKIAADQQNLRGLWVEIAKLEDDFGIQPNIAFGEVVETKPKNKGCLMALFELLKKYW